MKYQLIGCHPNPASALKTSRTQVKAPKSLTHLPGISWEHAFAGLTAISDHHWSGVWNAQLDPNIRCEAVRLWVISSHGQGCEMGLDHPQDPTPDSPWDHEINMAIIRELMNHQRVVMDVYGQSLKEGKRWDKDIYLLSWMPFLKLNMFLIVLNASKKL